MVKDRTVLLTAGGKTRLEEELEALQTKRLPDLTARIQEASQHGDVTDNGEYEELKEERVMVEARIRDLEQTLERAEIIRRDAADDTVGLGSKVTLRSDDGDEETWVLVSPEEAHALDGTISTESPVGRAVLGCRAGDSPTVTTPGGSMVFTVVGVA
jgi:transcription elongation factor GreA